MANGMNNKFNWPLDRWQRVNRVIHDQGAMTRIARRVLPLYGDSNGFKDLSPKRKVK